MTVNGNMMQNLGMACMHLTNYAVNKTNANFQVISIMQLSLLLFMFANGESFFYSNLMPRQRQNVKMTVQSVRSFGS
jgi:hypothetical protein